MYNLATKKEKYKNSGVQKKCKIKFNLILVFPFLSKKSMKNPYKKVAKERTQVH